MNAKDVVKKIAKLLEIGEGNVMSILEEDIISSINTIEEGKYFYYNCPDSMKPAVSRKWEELALDKLTSLKTTEEGVVLFCNCPGIMKHDVVRAMFKLQE